MWNKSEKTDPNITKLPRPSTWVNGPGGLHINPIPWDRVKARYVFIDEIEKLRTSVSGMGNLERFDYWLNQFKYLRAVDKFTCSLNEYGSMIKKMDALTVEEKKGFAVDSLLPLVKQEVKELGLIHQFLISSVTTWGGLGNVTNWQQHIIPLYMDPQINQLKDLML